jgi:hypothetical protein
MGRGSSPFDEQPYLLLDFFQFEFTQCHVLYILFAGARIADSIIRRTLQFP